MIKFRGFRKDGRGWVEGRFIKSNFESLITQMVNATYIDGNMMSVLEVIALPIIPESLGMSFGLPDKHGKQIFGSIEVDGVMSKGGDVLTCYDLKVAIVFEAGQFVGKHLNNGRMAELQNRNWLQFEIIGNQYESNGK